MLPPAEMAVLLEQRLSAAAEVRPAEHDRAAGQDPAAFRARLAGDTEQLLENAEWTRATVSELVKRERVFPTESRHALERIETLLRGWAPRFAQLHIPETTSFAIAAAQWVRPYNDAVRTMTRTLLDATTAIAERRAADEKAFTERVDKLGDDFAARHADILADLAK